MRFTLFCYMRRWWSIRGLSEVWDWVTKDSSDEEMIQMGYELNGTY